MNKLLLILGGVVGAVVLLLGGIALGDALTDDAPAAEAAPAASTAIPAATPVAIDPGAAPETVVGTDPDAAIPTPTWPAPSPHQLVAPVGAPTDGTDGTPTGGTARVGADLAAAFDPETGIDADTTAEPWVPPTSPAVDAATGEVDPDAPPVLEEGVEEIADDEIGTLFTPDLGLDLPFRFVDGCAGEDDGTPPTDDASEDGADAACPEGIGGTIVLTSGGTPPEPLKIMRQLYTSIGVPLELRCSPLGFDADGAHRAIFATNNPADFTIRYWLSTEPDDVHVLEWSTPEDERELWAERRIAGDATHASMHTGVHNCPEIPGLFPGRHTTFEIHGVDDFGTEADATIFFTPGTQVAGGGPVGRPDASFTTVDDQGHGLLTVPFNRRTEQVFVASLARAGHGATTETCTDVENGVLDRTRRLDNSLFNWEVTTFPRSDGDGFEPGIDSSIVTDFVGEEGTTYDLCVWVAKVPTRSFDKPPVVMRQVLSVRTPLRWRTRILLGGGHSDRDLEARSIRVRPTNWPSTLGGGGWPDEPIRAGAFFLDEMVLLREGGSSPVPDVTLLEVTGPTGAKAEVALPTPTRCLPFLFCDHGGFDQYDVAIPGPRTSSRLCGSGAGACDPPTAEDAIGNLRIVVETYAGPGGAPSAGGVLGNTWQVDRSTSFAAAGDPAKPAIPRIDHHGLRFEPAGGTGGIDGGRPGVVAVVNFDRPVTVTAQPQVVLGPPCPSPVAAQRSDGLVTGISMRFDGLCWGATYGLDLLATDADGNVLDARSFVDGVFTGRGPFVLADMPRVQVEEYSFRVTVDQIGGGYGAKHLSVGPVELVRLDQPTACLADRDPSEHVVRNHGGRPITLGDPWAWHLELLQAGNGTCGDPGHRARIQLAETVSLEDLLAGPVTLHFTHEDGTDITVEIYDVVFG